MTFNQQKKLIILYFFFLSITLPQNLYSQHQVKKCFWLAIGNGVCSIGNNGLSGVISANFQKENGLYSLRLAGGGEIFGKSLVEYSFLYSRIITDYTLLTSVGLGFGLVEGEMSYGLFSNNAPRKIAPTIGLPLEMQFIWRPIRYFGIGLHGFANMNFSESFCGGNVMLQVGKLR